MPRLLLNLLYLDPGRTGGMEVVARALIPELVQALPADWELIPLMNARGAASDGPWRELGIHTLPVDVSNRAAWVRAELQTVPRAAKSLGATMLHSLGNTGPWRTPLPHSVTVNDLIHHRVPHPGLALKSRITGAFVAGGAKRAGRVIVAASQTRDDLVDIAGIDPSLIDVVPYGISAPTYEPTPERELRHRLQLGDRPLILSPSARQPHKNLLRLIEAHALLDGPRPLLVLPGYETAHDDSLRERTRALGIDADVRWLGWIEQGDLEGLYACSELLVFPSLYEGFGLPVLEAMRRGVPVACSDRGSLAEITGDAALIFDPERPAAIANAVRTLHSDAALRDRLVLAGHAQADRFTWKACADGYVRSFERLLETAPRPQAVAAR